MCKLAGCCLQRKHHTVRMMDHGGVITRCRVTTIRGMPSATQFGISHIPTSKHFCVRRVTVTVTRTGTLSTILGFP
jgi:hypothetical protein